MVRTFPAKYMADSAAPVTAAADRAMRRGLSVYSPSQGGQSSRIPVSALHASVSTSLSHPLAPEMPWRTLFRTNLSLKLSKHPHVLQLAIKQCPSSVDESN